MVTFPASLATNLYSCGTGPAWGQDVAAALGLGYSLEVPGGQQGQSGHVLPGTGFTACVPGSGTHLDGQAQLGATGCMSPNCCIHGVTPVPGAGSSKGGTRTGGPRAFVLQPLGAWLWTRRFLLRHMCVLPSPPTPQEPRLALGPSGMQAPWLWGAAWRLASCYKKLWRRLLVVAAGWLWF